MSSFYEACECRQPEALKMHSYRPRGRDRQGRHVDSNAEHMLKGQGRKHRVRGLLVRRGHGGQERVQVHRLGTAVRTAVGLREEESLLQLAGWRDNGLRLPGKASDLGVCNSCVLVSKQQVVARTDPARIHMLYLATILGHMNSSAGTFKRVVGRPHKPKQQQH